MMNTNLPGPVAGPAPGPAVPDADRARDWLRVAVAGYQAYRYDDPAGEAGLPPGDPDRAGSQPGPDEPGWDDDEYLLARRAAERVLTGRVLTGSPGDDDADPADGSGRYYRQVLLGQALTAAMCAHVVKMLAEVVPGVTAADGAPGRP